ncbi:hypothetical protein LshimejAT787_1702130 [Lyophyllum shimeji]|uniref:Uncharacterized protein n=1 Tax=Lyophyllum shimeji TaxID=47721 RepID=A0A9P3PZP8_LYOSH|nr:hypothetical protein LshimejAT787_1702130 [Lyophyllum shimeji]
MAPRSTKPLSGDLSSDDEDEFNFLASQQSNGSEDQALEMALAKHYAAVREKKRKENEQKFLKTAYKQLSKEVAIPTEELSSSVETVYADFLQKYATSEDTIHKIWSQIQKEQQKLLTLVQKKLALNTEARKKIEANHISGLARTKAACRELQGIPPITISGRSPADALQAGYILTPVNHLSGSTVTIINELSDPVSLRYLFVLLNAHILFFPMGSIIVMET